MSERFILHIKTFDSKWVCLRSLADWAKPDVVEGGERVGRCRFKAFPSRWWWGGAN